MRLSRPKRGEWLLALGLLVGCESDLVLELPHGKLSATEGGSAGSTTAGASATAGSSDTPVGGSSAGTTSGAGTAMGGTAAAGTGATGGTTPEAGASGAPGTAGSSTRPPPRSCSSDDECQGAPSGPICSPHTLVCVSCLSDFECDSAFTCDPELSVCMRRCTADGDPACGVTQVCNTTLKQCAECLRDDDCPTTRPVCLNACVECRVAQECPAARPMCWDGGHACVECLQDADCASGSCSADHSCAP